MFGKSLNTRFVQKTISVILFLALMLFLMPCTVFAGDSTNMITSYTDLKEAIRAAKDGDVLYVGDIDFTPLGDSYKLIMRIEADKSLTIKSGKSDGKAVFTNGSFILSGSKASGDGNTFNFENIVFDGGVDTSKLKAADFDLQWSEEEQQNLLLEPLPAQYALQFKGNVDASFADCDFINYTHEYGPVMSIHYGDYTSEPYLLDLFGDYSACTLNLVFNRCRIAGNAAFYDGGAIYIEGNDHVSFTARDCVFENNYSGDGEFRIGGGAIYAEDTKLTLERCRIENNTADYLFSDMELPPEDMHAGGGLYAAGSELELINSQIVGNSASMGGGIALANTDAVIDGCVFTGNRAEQHSANLYGTSGPWSNMAQGGAIYHDGDLGAKTIIINSSIYDNSAENGYGGIYSFYNGIDDGISVRSIEMILCSYVGNSCDSVYDYSAKDMFPWCSHPGDIMEIPQFKASGCVIVDDSFAKDFPHHEVPSAENGYNYLASPFDADEDGIDITCPVSPSHLSFDMPKNMNTAILDEYAQKLVGERYEGKLKNIHIGDNYDTSLYPSTEQPITALYWIILSVAIAAILIVVAIILYKRKKQSKENTETEISVTKPENPAVPEPTAQPIVKAWFTKDEIDTILKSLPKVQTLTGRETEVFVEMLEGKKQKEIAYDLGIEITTVKDFYRKIYDKLGFSNKDELLKQCSTHISSK